MPMDAINAAPKLGSARCKNTGPVRRPGCSDWSPQRAWRSASYPGRSRAAPVRPYAVMEQYTTRGLSTRTAS
jgi:hypothetical protein